MNIMDSEPKLPKLSFTPIIMVIITISFNNLFSFNYNNCISNFSLISKSRKILKCGFLFIKSWGRTRTRVVQDGPNLLCSRGWP